MTRFISLSPPRRAFVATFLLALGFALYTNHVWEDYYITYRSSLNLATGHGLVYNHGDRLHTFTSPLGVLLPAVASLLTANSSDPAALWLFRLMCATAFGGAVMFLVSLTCRLAWPAVATGLLAVLLATDAKSLDFTINGMETAFMLLFLAYALWAHFSPGPRQWLHLGGAWAGLMWTRPDSFIYVGLIAAACWIFNQADRTGGDRRQQFFLFLRAGLLTTALYAPWLLWAGWYYGSPVPHTVVAKSAVSAEGEAVQRFLHGFWQLPKLIWQGRTTAEGSFLPSYYMFPAWPVWMTTFGRTLATVASLLWLVPRLRLEARVASFAYFFAICYLSFVPYFPFPWYLPATTLLALVALTGGLGQLWQGSRPVLRWLVGVTAGLILIASLTLTVGTARQARAQQHYIEDGNRRLIGEWLRAHAEPGDTVFMEPLGYIGFFSGLKTYDWPGMSSREVPAASRLVGSHWANLILYLEPNWLVLRGDSSGDLPAISPILASGYYERVRAFDRRDDIARLQVPGRDLLAFDAYFVVYRRLVPFRHDVDGMAIASPIPSSIRHVHGMNMRLVHAPGHLMAPLPPEARSLQIHYGFPDDAFTGLETTNGAIFYIWLVDGKTRTKLLEHRLEPRLHPQDRGRHEANLELPPRRQPDTAHVVFETDAMGDPTKDWTFWSTPRFE